MPYTIKYVSRIYKKYMYFFPNTHIHTNIRTRIPLYPSLVIHVTS